VDDDVEAFPILPEWRAAITADGIHRWWAILLGTFPDFHAEISERKALDAVGLSE
jgi:hypothetical protein